MPQAIGLDAVRYPVGWHHYPPSMCGIGGILRVWPAEQRELALRTPHAQSIPEEWLNIIDDSIKHRGPDGHGRFRDRAVRADGCVVDVAFVHRRLSIIDHAGGAQPMVSILPLPEGGGRGVGSPFSAAAHADLEGFPLLFHGKPNASVEYRTVGPGDGSPCDRIAVVFNGCIYNHRELRAELQRAGHVFTTDHSDTEVLVHGWREWLDDLHPALDGMFAAGIWDGGAAELVLLRDRFGEKPLYVLNAPIGPRTGITAFASSPVGLARLGAACNTPTLAEQHQWALAGWLALGWAERCVPIAGVHEHAVGSQSAIHRAIAEGTRDEWVVRRGKPREISRGAEPRGFRRAGEVEAAIDLAVSSRLEADVPLGCFLSGGVDSSLVAWAAAKRLRESGRDKLRTFTVRMNDSRFDESQFGEAAAKLIGSEHTTLEVSPTPAADLTLMIRQLGLPFGDSSLLASLWVSRAAATHVKVALGGEGGDELFAGYQRRIAWALLAEEGSGLGAVVGRKGARLLSRMLPARSEKLRRLCGAMDAGQYIELLRIFGDADLARLSPGLAELARRQLHGFSSPTKIDALKYLPHDLMRKSDTASMSVALEVRAPLLARSLADRALATSFRRLTTVFPGAIPQRKLLLRRVARRHFPAEFVDRPKMGFAIPIGEWFRSDYGGLRTMLLDHLNSTEPFGPPSLGIDLNMTFIRQMLEEHLGTGPSGMVKRDHSQRLYMLLVLSIWAKWIGGVGDRR